MTTESKNNIVVDRDQVEEIITNNDNNENMAPIKITDIPAIPNGKKVLDTVVNLDVDSVFK